MAVDLQNFKSGWRPENDDDAPKSPDFSRIRASVASAPRPTYASDLRDFSPSRFRHNQVQTSTCVAQSSVRALEIKRILRYYDEAIRAGKSDSEALADAFSKHIDLSRLGLYFGARSLMSPPETDKDEGTQISLAADALSRWGVGRESNWGFDLSKLFVPPSWMAMRDAYVHKIKTWHKIYSKGNDRVEDVALSLAVGNPVVYGTTVSYDWQRYDGSKPLEPVNGVSLGLHATVLIGWDANKQVFIGENSWGTGWGIDGFYEIRPEVIASPDSGDFVAFYGGWEDYQEAA